MATTPNRSDPRRWQRHRAVRVLASHARDAAELAELLDMLGLTPSEGRPPPDTVNREPPPTPRHASPTERNLATALLATVTDAIR
ncbi:MAG TPA: hypothetical protein VFV67_09545 [Actinophytocola sp.]|uniref:hypothetical protein n=1 Tax=Actinophytocola sp. TaxID=1872138 RepID=UPI002DBC4F47|nr:hypothetical protein [Actinophytocola sp.]HEU5470883.1 hypothetical protein [Actinophytocola sp.]